MDTDKARYVIRYYGHLMTMQERLAHRHLIGTAKATHGQSSVSGYHQAVVIIGFVHKSTNFNLSLVPQVSFLPITSKPKSIEIP